ncbi:MAG TPA: hypothetical protein PLB45_02800 [Bacilli bacterium]|jgi:hypothetical protein|nr:hypothetical protein [Bacilli bacterium]HQC83782.1 hypothetical protein [Bacilli bacterium]
MEKDSNIFEEELFHGYIECMNICAINNLGGCKNYIGENQVYYAYLGLNRGRYYDLNHPDRVLDGYTITPNNQVFTLLEVKPIEEELTMFSRTPDVKERLRK